jgi:hypothetical protein
MEISATDYGGDTPFVRVGVVPYLLANASARHFSVRIETDQTTIWSGPRLRREFLLGIPASNSSAITVTGGAKDENALWSEWSDETNLTVTNFTTTAARQSSIASVADDDVLIEDPAISFPDLNQGSGTMRVWRTVVTESWQDEVRSRLQEDVRASFNVKIDDADEEQVTMLHRLYQTTRGPSKPFLFDFINPHTGEHRTYTVRFADDSLKDSLETIDRSSLQFKLIEVVSASVGGDLV